MDCKIHLKNGDICSVNQDELEDFIVDHWDELTTKIGERFGPPRWQETMANVYLKHGLTAKIPLSMSFEFLKANAEIIEPRKIPCRRGMRRE